MAAAFRNAEALHTNSKTNGFTSKPKPWHRAFRNRGSPVSEWANCRRDSGHIGCAAPPRREGPDPERGRKHDGKPKPRDGVLQMIVGQGNHELARLRQAASWRRRF